MTHAMSLKKLIEADLSLRAINCVAAREESIQRRHSSMPGSMCSRPRLEMRG